MQDRAFIRMALAFDGDLPGYEPRYHPTYYLTDEASRKRIDALVERLAANPDSPEYHVVPASVRAQVDARREAEHRSAA